MASFPPAGCHEHSAGFALETPLHLTQPYREQSERSARVPPDPGEGRGGGGRPTQRRGLVHRRVPGPCAWRRALAAEPRHGRLRILGWDRHRRRSEWVRRSQDKVRNPSWPQMPEASSKGTQSSTIVGFGQGPVRWDRDGERALFLQQNGPGTAWVPKRLEA